MRPSRHKHTRARASTGTDQSRRTDGWMERKQSTPSNRHTHTHNGTNRSYAQTDNKGNNHRQPNICDVLCTTTPAWYLPATKKIEPNQTKRESNPMKLPFCAMGICVCVGHNRTTVPSNGQLHEKNCPPPLSSPRVSQTIYQLVSWP